MKKNLNQKLINLIEYYNLINANFCGSLIKCEISLSGLSLIWEPGQNIKLPVSTCSTITPPLHLDLILPIIGSLFS